MDGQLIATLAILAAALAAFASDRLRPDVVALAVMVLLGATGVLTPQETFSGFSRPAVITILAIFILAEGLTCAGVTERVGRLLLRLTGSSEGRLVVVVMLAGAFLSLFMNNIAAAAVLLPGVSGAARKAGVSPSRVLMPLAFATMLGGMATLLPTMNIVVGSVLVDYGHEAYGLLDFALLGLPIVAVGVVYMASWGRRLLPDRAPVSLGRHGDLLDLYRLGESLFRVRVPRGSYLVGRPLAESTFRERYGINVVAIERRGEPRMSPLPSTTIEEGDVLLLEGSLERFRSKDVEPLLEILPERTWQEQDLEAGGVVVVEAMLAPRSSLIGRTLREAHFRDKYGMTSLAIWRGGESIREDLADVQLQFGDALLLQGPRTSLPALDAEPDVILLTAEKEKVAPHKARPALVIMGATLVLAALQPGSIGEIMLGGALAMVLTGVLSMDQAYRTVEWRSVFVVAGMLPMGIALGKSGAAELFANGVVAVAGPLGPTAVVAGLLLMTVLLSQAMNGAAVAVVMAPVAIQVASHMGFEPRSLAMAVALGTSIVFLTPLGHAVNMLVMGAGGYHFRDYARVGWPLAVLLLLVIVALLPLVWPLQAA